MIKKLINSSGVQTISDYFKKCSDDHVSAFGAMSAFFIVLSAFPFLLIILMLTKYLPFTKTDIIHLFTDFLNFEDSRMIVSIINEIYRKTGVSAFTITVLTAIWGSSRGAYSILIGLNSVYDIDENRNYLVLRVLGVFYTILFVLNILLVMVVWVFGRLILNYFISIAPWIGDWAGSFLNNRIILSVIFLTVNFVLIYTYIPNLPNRSRRLFKQIPGALMTTVSWLVISELCAIYINSSERFSYVYGSMSWIMILLIWLYWCMSMLFYGAELNYYLENKDNYHELIRVVRPKYKVIRRANERSLQARRIVHHANSVYYNPFFDGRTIDDDLKKDEPFEDLEITKDSESEDS